MSKKDITDTDSAQEKRILWRIFRALEDAMTEMAEEEGVVIPTQDIARLYRIKTNAEAAVAAINGLIDYRKCGA